MRLLMPLLIVAICVLSFSASVALASPSPP
jgi:hypothetical protein